jgi:hypothetical protein
MSGRIVMVVVVLFASAIASADPGETVLPDPPAKRKPPKSLRDEATRVATELAAVESRRDPDLLLQPWVIDRWSLSTKAGRLEAGAAVATMAGEAVMGLGGSPLAALGAFAAAVTMDSAAADVEADAPTETTKPKKRIKHRLR